MNIKKKLESLNKKERKKLPDKIIKSGFEYGIYPLSPNQYSFWCKYNISENLNQFTNPCVAISFENITEKQITDALIKIFEIHDVFRYRFFELESWVYQYLDTDAELPYKMIDMSDLNDDKEKQLKIIEHDFYAEPFDLKNNLAERFLLVKKSESEFDLMIAVHHIICDGGSIGVIINDLRSIINGIVPEKKIRFGTYALEKYSYEGTKIQKDNEEYWIEKIKNTDKFIDFPIDYERCESKHHYAGIIEIDIKGEILNNLRANIQKLNCNMYVLLSSLFSIVLQKFVQKKSLIMATTFFNRGDHIYSQIAGDFASVCPLVFEADDEMTLCEYIKANMMNFIEGMDNSDVVFSRILDKYSDCTPEYVNPVYQVAMVYHSQNLLGMKAENNNFKMNLRELAYEGNIDDFLVDLYAKATEYDDKINFSLLYQKNIFKSETIENITVLYKKMIWNINNIINKKLKDITLYEERSINVYSELKLNAVKEIKNIGENTVIHNLNGKKLCITDEYNNSVPIDFFGEIFIENDEKWYSTGKFGRIRSNGELEINDSKSWYVTIGEIDIDLTDITENISNHYGDLEFYFSSPDNKNIIMNYKSDDISIDAEDLSKITGFQVKVAYKLSKLNGKMLKNHQKKILGIMERLLSLGYMSLVYQREKSDTCDIIISDLKAPPTEIIENVCTEFKDDRIFIRYSEKNIKEISVGEISQLFVYQTKIKSLTEKKLSDIWRRILETDSFGIYDRFYEAGGNSVKIYSLINSIEEEFNIKINVSDLFVYNTISELSAFIDRAKNITESDNKNVSILSF